MSDCPNGCGSINNPSADAAQTTGGQTISTYVPYVPCQGTWEIASTDPDYCAQMDQKRQESYVAEQLNIAGAPLNVYRLKGVHEQSAADHTSLGKMISSMPTPGYPRSGINNGGEWRSLETGANTSSSFIGVDFGAKSGYAPYSPELVDVGCVGIIQSIDPQKFARQVRIEIADGSTKATSRFIGSGSYEPASIKIVKSVVTASISLTYQQGVFKVQFVMSSGESVSFDDIANLQFISDYVIIQLPNVAYVDGDTFFISLDYVWKRVGVFALKQSPLMQYLNLNSTLKAAAIRVSPTLFTGSDQWAVQEFQVLESPKTSVSNIQDLFFGENRDRDYDLVPVRIKAQYTPQDSMMDFSKFGLFMMDTYAFTGSFASIVAALGRPLIVGDIIEVIPELQYDHNLKPIRKFVEVTDTSWASEGFSTSWKPTVVRFSAQQALPSQETRDIFGTMDTQKYLTVDSILLGDIGRQVDTTPLTMTEEIVKESKDVVPEVGSDDFQTIEMVPPPSPHSKANPNGNPDPVVGGGRFAAMIEDGLPKDGSPYTEGYSLPDIQKAKDGEYFRLNYAPNLNVASRLYRFSLRKNRWIYIETDRRFESSSHRPSVANILKSDTRQSLNKKV